MIECNDKRVSRRDRRLILAILAVFITAVPAIFMYPAERVLFNPEVYKQSFVAQRVYAHYPDILSDLFARQGEAIIPGSGRLFARMLERTGYEAAVQQIFPQTWVREQTESLVSQFWAYINFQDETLSLLVDFRPIKERLIGEEGSVIAQTIVLGFPPCDSEELLEFGLNILQGQVEELPLCRPPEQLLGIANTMVWGLLRASALSMPDQVNFASALRIPLLLGGERLETMLGGWLWLYRTFRALGPWLPLAALSFLGLTGYMARRTRRGPFYWAGVALVLPGMAGLLIVALIGLWSSRVILAWLEHVFAADLLLRELLMRVINHVMQQFSLTATWISLAVVLLGLLFVALAAWKRYSQPTDS